MNRTKLIYSKGAYVLSRLHKEIGDDAFLTFLRSREPTAARPYRQTCEEAR